MTAIVPVSEGDYQGVSFSQNGKFIYFTRSLSGQSKTVFKVPPVGGELSTLKKELIARSR